MSWTLGLYSAVEKEVTAMLEYATYLSQLHEPLTTILTSFKKLSAAVCDSIVFLLYAHVVWAQNSHKILFNVFFYAEYADMMLDTATSKIELYLRWKHNISFHLLLHIAFVC